MYKNTENTEQQYYYIGSTTTTTLAEHLWSHKILAKRRPEQKVYKYFSSINWDVRIMLISGHSFDNKDQLRREEDKIIKECLSDPKCLNCKREILTREETLENKKIGWNLIKDYIIR